MPDEESVEMPNWVTDFRNTLLDLDEDICAYLGTDPAIEDLCNSLLGLNLIKSELSMIYDHFASMVGEAMGAEQEVILAEGAKIEKKLSSTRTGWQHKDLAGAVAKKIVDLSVDLETGEIVSSTEEMLVQMLDFMQPSYWRIKELQGIGVNPDNYCEVGNTKTSIIVRKGSTK
jgi:hypothetical protein